MSTYGVGAVVRLSTEVRDSAKVLVTPADIQVTIQLPDGTTAGPFPPVSDGVGLYHYDFLTSVAGHHIARWATVTPTSNDEEPFHIAAMWAEAAIVSLGRAKRQLNIDVDDTDDDEEIADFLRSLTPGCERYVGSLVRADHVEKHAGGYGIALNRPPVLELTSVAAIQAGGVDQDVADLDLDGPTGIVTRLDGGRMCGPLRVTYVAGRTAIPANVQQAALIILQHMWETQRGVMSGAVRRGGSDEVYDPRFGFTIPRRAQELLGEQPPGIA